MYPLLVCSVVAFGVILERLLFWAGCIKNRDIENINQVLAHAEKGDFSAARTIAERSEDYLAKVLLCGIVHREFSLSDALQMAGDEAVRKMQKYLGVLDTIITLSPLLGIFGTVTGIIISFKFFESGGIADPKTVTSGIAQALITTATGLGVAIMTLLPYNYFLSRIESEKSRIEKYSTDLEIVYNRLKEGSEHETERHSAEETQN